MSTKHTPGPWETYYYRSPRGARQTWAVGSSETGTMGIARVDRKDDAYLIAAAPDLLAACKVALGAILNPDAMSSVIPEMLEKVIKKAGGE